MSTSRDAVALLAVALDEPAMRIVDALRGQATEWGADLIARLRDDDDMTALLTTGLVEMVSARGGAMPGCVQLAFISTGPLTASVIDAIEVGVRNVRARHRNRIGRCILALRDTFQPHGLTTRGALDALLNRVGDDVDRLELFGAIVLLDSVTVDGTPILPSALDDVHAVAVTHLTISELSTDLWRLVEQKRSALGPAGKFVSLGASEILFSGTQVKEQAATYLQTRMVELLQSDAAAVNPGTEPDRWCEKIQQRLFAQSPDRAEQWVVESMATEATMDLLATFGAAHHLGQLMARINARRQSLRRMEDHARADLATFMMEFVPWYTDSSLGLLRPATPTDVVERREELVMARVVALVISVLGVVVGAMLGMAGNGGIALVLILPCALVGLGVMLLGLNRTIATVRRIPAPPRRDWLRELERYRLRCEVLSDLVQYNNEIAEAVTREIASLEPTTVPGGDRTAPTHLLHEHLVQLLASVGLNPVAALKAFWQRDGSLSALDFDATAQPLGDRLIAFARDYCVSITELAINVVIQKLGGPSVLQEPAFAKRLAQSFANAAPCIGAEGAVTNTLVAVPHTLQDGVRQAILSQLAAPQSTTTAREVITIVQLTQGFIGCDDVGGAAAGAL